MVHLLIIKDWVNAMKESLPFEIFSGDVVQFGVDVTENNRKSMTFSYFFFNKSFSLSATHNCIIIEVKLYHSDGNEALPRR